MMQRVDRGKSLTNVVLKFDDGSVEELDNCLIMRNIEDRFTVSPFNLTTKMFSELIFNTVLGFYPEVFGFDED